MSTVNGQPWPTTCRPYASTSPWNIALPDSPTQISAFPASLESGGNVSFTNWTVVQSLDGGHPIYFAKSTDPTYTLMCVQYCPSGLPSTIQMPANAQPAAPGTDEQIGVIQPSGVEVDCWQTTISGSTVMCQGTDTDNILTGQGNGGGNAGDVTSGNSLLAGIIRSDELQTALNTTDGYIPHVVAVVVNCVTGDPVAPFGSSQASVCKSGTSVPIGAHIQYTQTFAQIDALSSASNYDKVILRTLHRYGAAVEDTRGGSADDGFSIEWEDSIPYIVNSQAVPWVPLAQRLHFSYNSGNGAWEGPDPGAADPNFSSHLVLVNRCYALKTCAQ